MKTITRTAVLSTCRHYRYELWRRWDDSLPSCLFVGLNPSTADETLDDPTIRRCVDFAQRWGYGSLCMANLFAWRATKPKDMLTAADPIGPDNDATLKRLAANAGIIIAAWGKHGTHLSRGFAVRALLPRLHYLKKNKDGSPRHPLYISKSAQPIPF